MVDGKRRGRILAGVAGRPAVRSHMTSIYTGQLILGTDKRNPLFTVYYQEEEDQEQLHVYYGLELLEIVSADRKEPSILTR